MKVTLEFTEDDNVKLDRITKLDDVYSALDEFSRWLRQLDKYEERQLVDIGEVRQQFLDEFEGLL